MSTSSGGWQPRPGLTAWCRRRPGWSWKALVGTNQAFGGSGSAEWERVREESAGLGSGGPGAGAGKGDAGEAEGPAR